MTSCSTFGVCRSAAAWAGGWASRAPGPGISAPRWALGGHLGPCWVGPGLPGPASQSEAVPASSPPPSTGINPSELFTPAKHLLPRGPRRPSTRSCPPHIPSIPLLPTAPGPVLVLPSAAGLVGGCPAWCNMFLEGWVRSPGDLSPLTLPPCLVTPTPPGG